MPNMRVSALHNSFAAGESDHEIALSTAGSPIAGALSLLREDQGSPYGEANPFHDIEFLSTEVPTTSGPFEETWSTFTVAPSPVSSDCSVFTPDEELLYPVSPYIALPSPSGVFEPPLSHPKLDELHHLAAEVGMQSPASYYPNSPTGSFADTTAQPPPPSSVPTSSPLVYQDKDIIMDMTSAPLPVGSGPSRPNTNDRPYAQLLRDCFLSRPDHSMSLKEIYKWFAENTNKAELPGKGWQNSIRHNLSMNAAFKKQDATQTQLNAGTDKGGVSRSRGNVWTMEQWAVEGRVQSTTRYRKSNSARRVSGHRSTRRQHHHAYGLSNYVLLGNEYSHDHAMDRAAAGRRGGVATRHGRERERAELQEKQRHNGALRHSSHVVPIGNSGWNAPRACSPATMAGFNVPDHFKMGSTPPGVTGYMGLHSGIDLGHQQLFGQPLPLPANSTSPVLAMGSSSSATTHMSPIQGHQHIATGCMPTAADMRGGPNQVPPPQNHQYHQHQVPGHQHHQHNGNFCYGSQLNAGDYAGGNGIHSVHHAAMSSANTPSFGPMDHGLKNWGTGHSSSGGA